MGSAPSLRTRSGPPACRTSEACLLLCEMGSWMGAWGACWGDRGQARRVRRFMEQEGESQRAGEVGGEPARQTKSLAEGS